MHKNNKHSDQLSQPIGHDTKMIDIGGGLQAIEGKMALFETVCESVNKAIETMDLEDITFISEPGTFLVETSQTLCESFIKAIF